VQCCASALNNIIIKKIKAEKFADVEQYVGTIVQYAHENPVGDDIQSAYTRMEKNFEHFKNCTGIFQKFAKPSVQVTEEPKLDSSDRPLGTIQIEVIKTRGENVPLGVEAPLDEEITKKPRKERLSHQVDPMELFNLFGDKENNDQTPPQGGQGRGR
jgi:hypothetical protein